MLQHIFCLGFHWRHVRVTYCLVWMFSRQPSCIIHWEVTRGIELMRWGRPYRDSLGGLRGDGTVSDLFPGYIDEANLLISYSVRTLSTVQAFPRCSRCHVSYSYFPFPGYLWVFAVYEVMVFSSSSVNISLLTLLREGSFSLIPSRLTLEEISLNRYTYFWTESPNFDMLIDSKVKEEQFVTYDSLRHRFFLRVSLNSHTEIASHISTLFSPNRIYRTSLPLCSEITEIQLLKFQCTVHIQPFMSPRNLMKIFVCPSLPDRVNSGLYLLARQTPPVQAKKVLIQLAQTEFNDKRFGGSFPHALPALPEGGYHLWDIAFNHSEITYTIPAYHAQEKMEDIHGPLFITTRPPECAHEPVGIGELLCVQMGDVYRHT